MAHQHGHHERAAALSVDRPRQRGGDPARGGRRLRDLRQRGRAPRAAGDREGRLPQRRSHRRRRRRGHAGGPGRRRLRRRQDPRGQHALRHRRRHAQLLHGRRRRQDRHHHQLRRRLVLRLQPQAGHRRLDGLPAGARSRCPACRGRPTACRSGASTTTLVFGSQPIADFAQPATHAGLGAVGGQPQRLQPGAQPIAQRIAQPHAQLRADGLAHAHANPNTHTDADTHSRRRPRIHHRRQRPSAPPVQDHTKGCHGSVPPAPHGHAQPLRAGPGPRPRHVSLRGRGDHPGHRARTRPRDRPQRLQLQIQAATVQRRPGPASRHGDPGRGARESHHRVRAAARQRRGDAHDHLQRRDQRRAARLLPQRLHRRRRARAGDRHHPVRVDRRPARLPVLGRARAQGDVPGEPSGARRAARPEQHARSSSHAPPRAAAPG